MKTRKPMFLCTWALACCLAAASAEAGMIFEVQQGQRSIIAERLGSTVSGSNWVAPNSSIGPYLIQDTSVGPDPSKADDWKLAAAEIRAARQGTGKVTAHWLRKDGLELRWTVRHSVGEDVWEFQSEVQNTGAAPIPKIRVLGPLEMHLAANPADLAVHYVARQDYRQHTAAIPAQGLEISGGGWNSPSAAGWVAVENSKAHEVLFLGVEWESYWAVRLAPQPGGGVMLQCVLNTQDHDLAPGQGLASPRVFLGVSRGDLDDSLRMLHDHLRHIMTPLPANFPWIEYDIWGTEAKGVEEALRAEIPVAAKLGVELFMLDAGWYEGSAKDGSGDWFAGVGNYGREDRVKFPAGLADLSRRVHAAGMKFGLWFAPQVVDSSLVGTVIPRDFVARRDGRDVTLKIGNWPAITQICTGNPRVVEHLKKVMGDCVERYQLDWLKWDNSGLPGPVCNDPRHGHQSSDGALAALKGQYEIWQYLRRRFPKLMLEECGYPSRLDYGLARFATSHWLSDDTSQSLRVRQGQIHASYVFPPAEYMAFIVAEEGVAAEAARWDTVVRSRMIGMCGVATLLGHLSERLSLFPPLAQQAMARNFQLYKQYRHLLREDVYHVLPPSVAPQAWDAVEFCRRDGAEAVLLAFRSQSPETDKVLTLRGLTPDARYQVKSGNSGRVRLMTGKELAAGLKVSLPAAEMSEILQIKSATPAGR